MKKILYKVDNNIQKYGYIYNGKIIDLMQYLSNTNQVCLSTADIMDLRNLAIKSGNQEWINQVCYNFFSTSDGAIYDREGRLKIDLDSENIKNLTNASKIDINGILNLEKDKYSKRFLDLPNKKKDLKFLYNNDQIKKYTSKNPFSQPVLENILKNEIWFTLARGNLQRLLKYISNVYSFVKNPNIMKIFLLNNNNIPSFESEMVFCLDSFKNYSFIYANSFLGSLNDQSDQIIAIDKFNR